MPLGETDAAFEWLEKAYAGRESWLDYVALDPRLDGLHGDHRFADLLRRLKLPPLVPNASSRPAGR